MDNSNVIRAELTAKLADFASKHHRDVTDATDIYSDLGINGWDLCEFLEWVAAKYDTDLSAITPKHYDINEPPASFWRSPRNPYKAVTVGELVAAIQRGHWIVPD